MWNSIPGSTEALRALAGSRLHTLEVYRGGIALGFDAGYLRLSALPTVRVDTQVFGSAATRYFSKLHGLVADVAVAAALTRDMTLAIRATLKNVGAKADDFCTLRTAVYELSFRSENPEPASANA